MITLTFIRPNAKIDGMSEQGIFIEELPELNKPVLIAGFDGWGNALDVSNGMAKYLINKLTAKYFARINPDTFYRYDEARPVVNIENGDLKSLSPQGGSFYASQSDSVKKDLIILKAHEPNLRWFHFVDELFSLCEKLGVETIITLGSMYDNVLHTDRIISGIASNQDLLSKMREQKVIPISYHGPSAIHSIIHSEGQTRGFQSISLWCHCPYYLQGITHYGVMSSLGELLSLLGEFELEVEDLEKNWEKLNKQIQVLIENNPEFGDIIDKLRKEKIKGSWASMKGSEKKNEKVISLKDYLEPR